MALHLQIKPFAKDFHPMSLHFQVQKDISNGNHQPTIQHGTTLLMRTVLTLQKLKWAMYCKPPIIAR